MNVTEKQKEAGNQAFKRQDWAGAGDAYNKAMEADKWCMDTSLAFRPFKRDIVSVRIWTSESSSRADFWSIFANLKSKMQDCGVQGPRVKANHLGEMLSYPFFFLLSPFMGLSFFFFLVFFFGGTSQAPTCTVTVKVRNRKAKEHNVGREKKTYSSARGNRKPTPGQPRKPEKEDTPWRL